MARSFLSEIGVKPLKNRYSLRQICCRKCGLDIVAAKSVFIIKEAPSMLEKWKDKLTDQLCKAFLSLQTPEEVYSFLEDVATIGEIRALSQRLEVSRLLSEGYTYPQIAQQTGASTATISRVKKFLEYGADGYKIVLERIKKDNK